MSDEIVRREERIIAHGPPVQRCLTCGCAAYNHRGTEPHGCLNSTCGCPALRLAPQLVDSKELSEECGYCGHALQSHLAPIYGCKQGDCCCKQFRSSTHPRLAGLKKLYERHMKKKRGELPETVYTLTPRAGALQKILGRTPVVDAEVKKAINEYVIDTIEELGGIEHLTAGQQAVLLGQRVALEVIMLAEKEFASAGRIVSADGDPLGALRVLQGYLAAFRQGQVALGLAKARRSKQQDVTIEEVMREYAKKKKA